MNFRSSMTVKILLDTDIGNDIDDAICLSHLLANPDCELMGITTVTGEATTRASIASILCKIADKKIPIYPGSETPLLAPAHQTNVLHEESISRWDHDRSFPKGQAIHFMQDIIHAYPGEICLLTIGPLTNIALLFGLDPEIPKLLKGLFVMGGVFTNRIAGAGPLEWNILCDPHASAVVYKHSVDIHRTVGLDVTCQLCMSKDEFHKHFKSETLRPVVDFAQHHFVHSDMVVFHDPLAAVAALNQNVCCFEKGHVDIELGSHRLSGLTHWTPDEKDGRHEVAMSVDSEEFFNYYFSVF